MIVELVMKLVQFLIATVSELEGRRGRRKEEVKNKEG